MPVREEGPGLPLPSGHWKQLNIQTENIAFGFWLEFKSVHSGTSANVSGRPIPLKTEGKTSVPALQLLAFQGALGQG